MGRKGEGESQDYILDLLAYMRAGAEIMRDMNYKDEADEEHARLDKWEEAHYRTLMQDASPNEGARVYGVSPAAIRMRVSRGTLENHGEEGSPAIRFRELFRGSYADAIRGIHQLPADRPDDEDDTGDDQPESVGPDGKRRPSGVVARTKLSPEEAQRRKRKAAGGE